MAYIGPKFGYSIDAGLKRQLNSAGDYTYSWGEPGSYSVRLAIQSAMYRKGTYNGLRDGIWGPKTIAAIQETVKRWYGGAWDGIPGENTKKGILEFANNYHGYPKYKNTAGLSHQTQSTCNQIWNSFSINVQR
jgi:hypothetical protein